jgi:hypothetical protein
MSLKIDEMVKTKEVYMSKVLQARMIMADKKNAMKQARWEVIHEDDKCKAALEERRLELEEKNTMIELIANENRTMMMDPSTMNAMTREWSDMRREEILKRRR